VAANQFQGFIEITCAEGIPVGDCLRLTKTNPAPFAAFNADGVPCNYQFGHAFEYTIRVEVLDMGGDFIGV
jgi:hypothetical protein